MRRAAFATMSVVLVWAIQDILVWQRLFEARGLYQFDTQYQNWHHAFLVLMIVAGTIWIRNLWAFGFAVATWTLAYSGLADVLYYWLDLRAIPDRLPWLDIAHPWILVHPVSSAGVVISSTIWLGFWIAAIIVAMLSSRRLERSRGRTDRR